LREECAGEGAGLCGVVGIVGAAGGFEGEVAGERWGRDLGGVEQGGDGVIGMVGAGVEVGGGADDAEDSRVG
jgi:hypothetical protein